MQKYIITFLILLICNLSLAQISSPQASPRSKIFQKVGLVDISIDYSRPSKKERKIFGNIVPFDEVWRTGANQATAISFSEDVKVNSKLLKAGEYFLYSIPDSEKNGLSLIFYEKNKNWGALKEIDENKVLLKGKFVVVGVANIDIYTGKTSIFQFKEAYVNNPTTYDELERFISIYNPNEVILINKMSKNKGFFEKFFDFFSYNCIF